MAEIRHDLVFRWIEAVRTAFPANAKFYPEARIDAQLIGVAWPLGDEPNKRSREISLKFTEEAVDDYTDSTEEAKARGDQRLDAMVRHRLKTFDPKHNAPEGATQPGELWLVTTEFLNGRANPVWE